MGSSTKKHKNEKRRKRSRSPEKERERHRHHKRHKSHKRKYEEAEIISSSDSDVEEVAVIPAPPPPRISTSPPPPIVIEDSPPRTNTPTTEGKSHESLSIDETNALRAKLGLKPLQVDTPKPVAPEKSQKDKSVVEDGTDMGEFVHKPAVNIAEKTRSEKIRQRLTERKEKRAIDAKLKNVRGLGESDSDDDTKNWVKKSRQKEKERREADKKAKQLEELDAEFGIGALVEEERISTRRDMYTTRDLMGLKVGHSTSGFNEGKSMILTLKDQGVLSDDEDTLINVNMIDNERYKKNVERKLKKPKLYEEDVDNDFLTEGSKHDVLSKYDEEIDGEKQDSFKLGENLSDSERIKKRLLIKKKLMMGSAIDLNSDLRIASDYYTAEEASAVFRKPKIKKKKLRKKPKPLKADDLMPEDEVQWPSEDFGRRHKKPVERDNSDHMDIVKSEIDVLDVDDVPAPSEDLYKIKIEPDEAELDLQLALSKARKLKQKEKVVSSIETIARDIVKTEPDSNVEGGSIILNSTAEFCRTLGDIPTYGLSGNREEEEELLDFEREMKEESKRQEEEKQNRGAWNQVELDERPTEIVPKDVPILDEEPDVGKGLAGALRLAMSKGYLEKETDARPSASRFAHLQAQNYSIDDKAHADDDKFGRRDRYMGPTSDFKEKDNYKPNVQLDYIDDDGRRLCSKEAFRYMSHKFHGKGPGKNKVEKRMKKNEQEGLMKQMSSTDTPLRTLTMLQNKQKETQSPYVILSGNKQAAATISKSK